jgi:hypothetical protein
VPGTSLIIKGVTDDELQAGRQEHAKKGAGPLKNLTALGPTNIMTKLTNFVTVYPKETQNMRADQVLLAMTRTGAFFPQATLYAGFGGRGMDLSRFLAASELCLHPELASLEDVHEVYFNHTLKVHRWLETEDEDAEEPWEAKFCHWESPWDNVPDPDRAAKRRPGLALREAAPKDDADQVLDEDHDGFLPVALVAQVGPMPGRPPRRRKLIFPDSDGEEEEEVPEVASQDVFDIAVGGVS